MADELKVGEVPVRVVRKKIKHMHLYVRPPSGEVLVTAPLDYADEVALAYVRENFGWVLKQRACMRGQLRQTPREYISGETHYVWGRQYFMEVLKQSGWGGIRLSGNNLLMLAPFESTVKSRGEYMSEWYRRLLKEALDIELPKWEEKTGLHCVRYDIKLMTRSWGSCMRKKGQLTFNLQLSRKPKEGLAYVILHELCHLAYANHGKEFIALLDKYMPNWREVRKRLNDAPLDFVVEDWKV